MRNIVWTQELDDLLLDKWPKLGPTKLARELGMSRESVRGRMRRLKEYGLPPPGDCCHVAVDDRSAELLRAAGWNINARIN